MTHRPHRHPDGVGRKRYASISEPYPLGEFMAWAADAVGDGYDATVSRGAFVEWYTPATVEELALEAQAEQAATQRTLVWENKTMIRLLARHWGITTCRVCGGEIHLDQWCPDANTMITVEEMLGVRPS